jgi:hypothetical protein
MTATTTTALVPRPARIQRRRTARPRRIPGRIPRPDARGVRAGSARAHGRPGLHGRRRAAAGPARRRADRPQGRPPRRNRQGGHAAHAQTCVHHRRARCRGPAARRARGRIARWSENHDAVRPGTGQPGPARHVHRRRVHRGRRQVIRTSRQLRLAATSDRAELAHSSIPAAEADGRGGY